MSCSFNISKVFKNWCGMFLKIRKSDKPHTSFLENENLHYIFLRCIAPNC